MLQHPGAGLAPWNLELYDVREEPGSGRLLVDDVPLVFFHHHGLQLFRSGGVTGRLGTGAGAYRGDGDRGRPAALAIRLPARPGRATAVGALRWQADRRLRAATAAGARLRRRHRGPGHPRALGVHARPGRQQAARAPLDGVVGGALPAAVAPHDRVDLGERAGGDEPAGEQAAVAAARDGGRASCTRAAAGSIRSERCVLHPGTLRPASVT